MLCGQFTVIIDHASLKWLSSQKDLARRLGRCSMKLQGYNYKMEHQKEASIPKFAENAIDLDSFDEITDVEYARLREKLEEDPGKYPEIKVHNKKNFEI